TVRRLANHTSGLPMHWDFFYEGSEPPPMEETIRRYGFAVFEPGTRWVYSNLAFGFLGHIVERVTGTPFGTFVDANVFEPLKMKRSSLGRRLGLGREQAEPYATDAGGRFVRIPPYDFDHRGASAFRCSANDLARFLLMHLQDGELDGVRVL